MPAEAGSIIQDMVQQGVLDSKISVEEVVKKQMKSSRNSSRI